MKDNFKIFCDKKTSKFKSRSREIHGSKFNYDKVFLCKNSDKVIIKCLKHGDFEQEAQSHLKGHGCKKCALELPKGNRESLLKKIKAKCGEDLDLSKITKNLKKSSFI